MTLLGQVDGVVAEAAADVEHLAVDQPGILPADDILLGSLGIPRRRGDRRHTLGGALTPVEGIEIELGNLGGRRRACHFRQRSARC